MTHFIVTLDISGMSARAFRIWSDMPPFTDSAVTSRGANDNEIEVLDVKARDQESARRKVQRELDLATNRGASGATIKSVEVGEK
jgi:hypothetical protein